MRKKINCIAKAKDVSGRTTISEYAIQSDTREGLLKLLYAHEKSLSLDQKSEFLSGSLQKEYLRYKAKH